MQILFSLVNFMIVLILQLKYLEKQQVNKSGSLQKRSYSGIGVCSSISQLHGSSIVRFDVFIPFWISKPISKRRCIFASPDILKPCIEEYRFKR